MCRISQRTKQGTHTTRAVILQDNNAFTSQPPTKFAWLIGINFKCSSSTQVALDLPTWSCTPPAASPPRHCSEAHPCTRTPAAFKENGGGWGVMALGPRLVYSHTCHRVRCAANGGRILVVMASVRSGACATAGSGVYLSCGLPLQPQ